MGDGLRLTEADAKVGYVIKEVEQERAWGQG